MVNLLPEDLRGVHRKRVVSRAFLVWGGAAVLLLFIGLLVLIPAYAYVHIRASKNTDQIKSEQKTHEKSEAMQEVLANDDLKVRSLQALLEQQLFSEVYAQLTDALANHPEAEITDVSFLRGSTTALVTIRGMTRKRESLVQLVRALERDKHFQSTTLPISDLAGRDGAFPFTITLQTKKQL
jgi:hypothetical protein